MAHPMRRLRIDLAPYQYPFVSCDTCLATDKVQTHPVPIVDAEGSILRVMPQVRNICEDCLKQSTRPAADEAHEGTLVYLHWHRTSDHIVRGFVFAPLMFRDALF